MKRSMVRPERAWRAAKTGMTYVAAIVSLALVAPPAAFSAGATPAPVAAGVEVYGRLPAIEDVAVSPDGRRIAYVRTQGDQRAMVVDELATGRTVSGVVVGQQKLRAVDWLDAQRVLVTVSTTRAAPGLLGPRREWFIGHVYDVDSRRLRAVDLRIREHETLNTLSGRPVVRRAGDRTVMLIQGTYFSGGNGQPGLFEVDVESGRTRIVARGADPWTDWLVDASGAVAAVFGYDDRTMRWTLRARRGAELPLLASGSAAIDVPGLVGLTADGAGVVLSRSGDGAEPSLEAIAIADGTVTRPFGEEEARAALLEARTEPRIVGWARGSQARYWFTDPAVQQRWSAVVRAFRGARVHFLSASDDFGVIAVRVEDPERGPVVQVVDWATKRAEILGELYPGVQGVAEVRAIEYAAGDGLKIPGFLTLPPGREPKGLPLVVLPHGGPAAVDTANFDWWAQALASQGYAVLQPNFRGSTVSWAHLSAGFGQWGRKMQTDLSDGVRWLASQGTVDPARVCIVGASYGGYAALAGVALEPDVYRCAASIAGLSDLRHFLQWTDTRQGGGDSLAQRWWNRFMGVDGSRDALLAQISPALRADAIRAPVMLIHGRDDTVVPFEQSERMADALRRLGKPVEMVTLGREDHWLSRGETRVRMLQESVRFLREHNPP